MRAPAHIHFAEAAGVKSFPEQMKVLIALFAHCSLARHEDWFCKAAAYASQNCRVTLFQVVCMLRCR